MNRIKQLRIEKGISQQGLADLLNIAQQTISSYEKGTREPDSELLKTLSEYFNVSIDYLLGNTDIRETADAILKKAIGNGQIYFHRTDGYDEDLPDSAKEEIANFIEYVKHKYKK